LSNNKMSILVVGCSGNLGSYITREALIYSDKINVNVLFHDISKRKELADLVTKAGGKVFEGDVTKKDTIKDITKGMHTVISALVGGDDVIIDGQIALLEDAERNGVSRFVPSDFSFDIWNIPKGRHFFTDQRLKFNDRLSKSKVKSLHFTNGMFMETFFWLVNNQHTGFTYWGDINQKIDLTAEEDVAKFVMVAILDKKREGHVKICSSELSSKEIVELYNKILGKNEQAKFMGSIEDLKNKVNELKEKEIFESIQLGYVIPMFDGSGKIKNRMNSQFPEVKVMTLEDFIIKTHGKPDYQCTIPFVTKEIQYFIKPTV